MFLLVKITNESLKNEQNSRYFYDTFISRILKVRRRLRFFRSAKTKGINKIAYSDLICLHTTSVCDRMREIALF